MFSHAQKDFMKELWWELSGCMSRAGLWSERGTAELPSISQRCSWGPVEEEQALEEEWQNGQSKSVRGTCSRGRSGLRWHQSPPLYAQANASPHSLALHDPILLMSSSTTPWRILSYNPSLGNPRAWHGDTMPPHRRRKNQGSKSSLR